MTEEEIVKELVELLERIGVIGITVDNIESKGNDDIREYIEDSLQLVNFIVSVEKIFKIVLPDAFLFADFSITFDILIDYIQSNIK